MKLQENIAKHGPVIWKEYERKLNQLDILFQFVRYAFGVLSRTKQREFVQTLKKQELQRTNRKWDNVSGDFEGIEEIFEWCRKRSEKEVRLRYRGKKHTEYAGWVDRGMIAAEILFRITVFEDFLRHVHAAILNANIGVLAKTDPTKSSTYKDVFAGSFEQYKEKQICRSFEELRGMKKRLDYFGKYFRIDFGKKRVRLIEISRIRNRIAHGYPLEAISGADVSVPLQDIAGIIRESMVFAFREGRSNYPHSFQ